MFFLHRCACCSRGQVEFDRKILPVRSQTAKVSFSDENFEEYQKRNEKRRCSKHRRFPSAL